MKTVNFFTEIPFFSFSAQEKPTGPCQMASVPRPSRPASPQILPAQNDSMRRTRARKPVENPHRESLRMNRLFRFRGSQASAIFKVMPISDSFSAGISTRSAASSCFQRRSPLYPRSSTFAILPGATELASPSEWMTADRSGQPITNA